MRRPFSITSISTSPPSCETQPPIIRIPSTHPRTCGYVCIPFTTPVYVQFWKLLLGVGGREELPHATDIFRCEMLSARIQLLANDLCSLERDVREGSPNIVSVVARHGNIQYDLALRTVRQWHDNAVSEYVDATRRASKVAPPGPVADYLEFIESCTAGVVQTMRSLASRYSYS